MACIVHDKDISETLEAAASWIARCLINDRSLFAQDLWMSETVLEFHRAFDGHPDEGKDDFMTKLRGQMTPPSGQAQRLMAEMLWALLLFPSNMKGRTKRQQVRDI